MARRNAGWSINRWSVSRKALLVVAVPVIFQLLLLLAIAAGYAATARDRRAEVRSREFISSIHGLQALLSDVESGVRGYAISGNAVFLERYDSAVAAVPSEFMRLRQLAEEHSDLSATHSLQHLAEQVLDVQEQNRRYVQAGAREFAIDRIESRAGKVRMDAFRAQATQMLNTHGIHDARRREHSARLGELAIILIIAAFLINLLIAAAAARFFTRNITERLKLLVENTARIPSGGALHPPQPGSDEIASLDQHFHEMAIALQEGRQQLEETNNDLESFSYSVSHDLRAPLRAIDGYAQMVEEDSGEVIGEDGRRHLAIVRNEAARLGRLIDDLLTFSRLGRRELTRSEIDMNVLVAETFKEVRRSSPPDLDVTLQVTTLPPASGDRILLRQVLINLIGNAVKFSQHTRAPSVIVSAMEQEGETIYSVRDRGAGFDQRFATKLFGVFQRLHAEEEFPGTGVGLAIVRRIVERHGGRVWAESEIGKGATFYFTLPKDVESPEVGELSYGT